MAQGPLHRSIDRDLGEQLEVRVGEYQVNFFSFDLATV